LTRLIEWVERLEQIDEELTLYVANSPEWNPQSEAIASVNPEETQLPIEVDGIKMDYFLERVKEVYCSCLHLS